MYYHSGSILPKNTKINNVTNNRRLCITVNKNSHIPCSVYITRAILYSSDFFSMTNGSTTCIRLIIDTGDHGKFLGETEPHQFTCTDDLIWYHIPVCKLKFQDLFPLILICSVKKQAKDNVSLGQTIK